MSGDNAVRPEIEVEGEPLSPLNMTDWPGEKPDFVLRALVQLHVLLKQDEITDDDRSWIETHLPRAIYDATKIVAAYSGCRDQWSDEAHDLIMTRGMTGYAEVLRNYGLSDRGIISDQMAYPAGGSRLPRDVHRSVYTAAGRGREDEPNRNLYPATPFSHR